MAIRTEEHARKIREAVQKSWGSPLAQEIVKATIEHLRLPVPITQYPARSLVPIVQAIIEKHEAAKSEQRIRSDE